MIDPDPARPVLRLGELQHLAETAEERTHGYLRKALKDPRIKAAVHSRYVPDPIPAAQTVKQYHRLFDGFAQPVGDGAVRF